MFQNERQRKTAGSFLLRLEPFYRELGASSGLVPSSCDKIQVYGEQTGLQYLRGVGCLVMPGYGITVTPFGERFYISPMIFCWPMGWRLIFLRPMVEILLTPIGNGPEWCC